MSNKTKTHWPTALGAYFVVGVFLSMGSFAIRHHSLTAVWYATTAGATAELIVLVMLSIAGWYLHRKFSVVRSIEGCLIVGLKKLWHLLLGWTGAGLWIFSIAEIMHGGGARNIPMTMLLGPLAFLTHPNAFLIFLLFVGGTIAFVEMMRETKIANHKGGKGSVIAVYRNAQKFVHKGADWAPPSKPDDAHFAETVGELSGYLIKNVELPNRVSFGVATVADEYGKKKHRVEIGLPKEGSGMIVGAPSSGKTIAGHRMLLNIEKADQDKGILPVKVIVTSIKPRDISGVVTPYFRSLGMKVQMWDLTGKTTDTDTYGDPARWSPVLSASNYDKATLMGKRIVQSARDPEKKGETTDFWDKQNTIAVAVPLLASHIRRRSYEQALQWSKSWDDPKADDVEGILRSHGDADGASAALQDWCGLRSAQLDRNLDGTWSARPNGAQASVTGESMKRTLDGIMTELARQEAYDATDNPNFHPKEWVRAEGSSGLFLIGNMRQKGMTRSLFAPVLEEIIAESLDFANECEDEKLPFRLVIFLDEIANLAPIASLEEIFSTSRSTGISIIAVVQSYAQFELLYGPTVARILLGSSTVILVLAGATDPDFIRDLSTIGGSKRVELNDDQVSTHPLIEGQHLLNLKKPDTTKGAPGTALMIMDTAATEIEMPFWAMEPRYDDRGTIMHRHREMVEMLRAGRDPWARRLASAEKSMAKTWSRATSSWGQRGSAHPPIPMARPLVPRDETAEEPPSDSITSRPETTAPSSAFNPPHFT